MGKDEEIIEINRWEMDSRIKKKKRIKELEENMEREMGRGR